MWGAGYGPAEGCGGPAHSKHGVASGTSSEGGVSRAMMRGAPRQAGNRAAFTPRSVQWRDNGPECSAQITLPGMHPHTTFPFVLPSSSHLCSLSTFIVGHSFSQSHEWKVSIL
uniref:Uncharacterized protein n=1 Tax=Physcomitrium patens TaxID=3218 RepID=A0A2K1IBP5_PHYPA|nr:hypothetical protein PHYPA_030191 [Physcomitrium patens]